MAINQIINNLEEANNLLKDFINDPKNIENIEKAGALMVKSIRNKNKIISIKSKII